MKFSFECLHLDQHYSELFTNCMINNQLITNYSKNASVIQEDFFGHKRKLCGIKKLLRLIVLFEKIDFMFADEQYDYSKVLEMELMETDAFAFVDDFEKILNKLNGVATCESFKIFKMYKQQIIKEFKFGIRFDCEPLPEWKAAITREKFNEYFDEYLRLGLCEERNTPEKYIKYLFHKKLSNYHIDLSICLNPKNHRTYCSDIILDPLKIQNIKKMIDDVYYITKIRLPDEINILPMPQTLGQALKMRDSVYVKSFRKIMKEWMYYLDNGDILLAQKMKKDVINANQNLVRLERYKKFPPVRLNIGIIGQKNSIYIPCNTL